MVPLESLESWKIFEPDSYYRDFLEKKQRPDGRSISESRPMYVRVNSVTTADGSASVRLGNTSVVCGIKAELAVPSLRESDLGYVVPNVELYPCCSASVKPGMPGEKAMETGNFLKEVLQSCNLVDLTDLCVVPSKLSWCLYCDIVCLDYDGNLRDACLAALISALLDLRLPKVNYDIELKTTKVASERTEVVRMLLIDPTGEDESNCHGEMTAVMLDNGSLVATHKPGGMVVPPRVMEELLTIAQGQVGKVNEIIDRAIIARETPFPIL